MWSPLGWTAIADRCFTPLVNFCLKTYRMSGLTPMQIADYINLRNAVQQIDAWPPAFEGHTLARNVW